MQLYILVEGKRTEMRIYPSWIESQIEGIQKYSVVTDVGSKELGYYIISGLGMPRLLDVAVPRAVADIRDNPDYTNLVIIVDSEGEDNEELETRIIQTVEQIELPNTTQLHIVIQNVCIETWLLGNRQIVGGGNQCETLKSYLDFANVKHIDPEIIDTPAGYTKNQSQFHLDYLKRLFREKNLKYTKNSPRIAAEPHYLSALIERHADGDLASLASLMSLFKKGQS